MLQRRERKSFPLCDPREGYPPILDYFSKKTVVKIGQI